MLTPLYLQGMCGTGGRVAAVLMGRADSDVCLCCGVASEGQRGQGLHGKRG